MTKKEITRQNKIAESIKKAKNFYKENGFMDLSRFSSYFPKNLWKDDDSRIHFLVNCYNLIFSK